MQSIWRRRVPQTWFVVVLCLGMLGGLLWARFGHPPNISYAFESVLLMPLVFKRKWPALFVMMTLGMSLGLWRGQTLLGGIQHYDDWFDRTVTLQGIVSDDAAYSDRGQLSFHIVDVRDNDDAEVPGKIAIKGFSPGVLRGDIVTVTGKLRRGFGANQAAMSFADIEIIGRRDSFVERIRGRFFAGLYSALPEPQASLGLGFLVGARSLLPDDLTKELTATGLTHIVAVSGYNLTILVDTMRRMLSKRSKYLTTISSLGLISVFIAITGFSASIVRAAIVSTLTLWAWYFGRTIQPFILLITAATISAMFQPLYFWTDLGWYLSFLAFFGIIVVAPTITKRLYKAKKPRLVPQIIIETTSAQLMTIPLIAYIFGELSIVALLANLVILPLVPMAMLLTAVAGLAGMFSPYLAGWLAWPARTVLGVIVQLVELLARIPGALREVQITREQFILYYVAVLTIIFIMKLKVRRLDEPLTDEVQLS